MIYIILGFFLGSIPFGLIVGKIWLGTDVRQQGSGNIGMTNVMRIGGKGPGVLTFVLDFLKLDKREHHGLLRRDGALSDPAQDL